MVFQVLDNIANVRRRTQQVGFSNN